MQLSKIPFSHEAWMETNDIEIAKNGWYSQVSGKIGLHAEYALAYLQQIMSFMP